MTEIAAIDIASYQGLPNFDTVKAADYGAVLDKWTQGTHYINTRAAATWPAIKAAGLLRGAYHYAEPDVTAPEAEAAYFLAHTPLEPGDVIALDLEEGTGDLSDWVLRWLRAVAQATGTNPWLYTNLNYLNNHGLGIPAIADTYGLWLAWPASAQPPPPAPFPFLACWQRGTAAVPGIAGPCDIDVFNGDEAAWLKYGVPAAPVPAPKRVPTNDDLVYLGKFLFAPAGPDLAGLSGALTPFV